MVKEKAVSETARKLGVILLEEDISDVEDYGDFYGISYKGYISVSKQRAWK